MMWHVVFAEPGRLPQSRAAKSRDHAIQVACELLSQTVDVRRIFELNGRSIERPELDEHFDEGRFPGLRRRHASRVSAKNFELDWPNAPHCRLDDVPGPWLHLPQSNGVLIRLACLLAKVNAADTLGTGAATNGER